MKALIRSLIPIGFCALTGLLTLVAIRPAGTQPASGAGNEAKALAAMSDPMVEQTLGAIGQLAAWRQQAQTVKKMVQDNESPELAVKFVQEIERNLLQEYPKVREYLNYAAALQSELAAAKANVEAAKKLIDDYERKVFKGIEALRDPAQTAKNLLEGKIRQFVQQPIKEGDVTFQITQRDENKSIFAKDAGIGIEVVYLDKIKVKADGLYFKKDGTPVFDNVKLKSNIGQILSGLALTSLGDAIPDLGSNMPIKLKYKDFLGFDKKNGRRGGIKFDIEINFIDFLPKLKAENLVLYTDGHVDFDSKDGLIKVPALKQAPLGTTGLGLYDLTIGFNPRGKKVSIECDLSTYPGSPQAVTMHGTVFFDIPISKVNFEGELRVANQVLGEMTGEITKEYVKGTLKIPGENGQLPIDALAEGDAKFEINREGFFADGKFRILQTFNKKMDMAMRFNGHGSFESSETLRILGSRIEQTMSVVYTPGFRKVRLEAMFSAEIDLGIFKPDVSVVIVGENNRQKPFHVVAKAMGATATLELADFDDLESELKRALREKLPNMIENTLKEMAKWEGQARGALADAEKEFREGVHTAAKRVGIDKLSTGNEQADEFLGDMSNTGKRWGGMLAKENQNLGKTLTDLRQNPLGTVTSGAGRVVDVVSGALGGILGGGGSSDDSAQREAERREREARERHDKINKKLAKLVAAIKRHRGIHRTPSAQKNGRGWKRVARKTELHIRFDEAGAGVAKGKNTDGVVAFTIKSSGYTSLIGNRFASAAKPRFEAAVQSGTVYIKNLAAKDKNVRPVAKINIPGLKHGSTLPARQLVHDEIQRLIELYLPEAEIEGNLLRREKNLAVRNNSKENIKVYVQIESEKVGDGRFFWFWNPDKTPGPRGRRWVFYLKPQQTLALKRSLSGKKAGDAGNGVSELFENQERDELQGRSARLWAESETGRIWKRYKNADYFLVKRNREGKRQYRSKKVETFTYSFKASAGPRVFNERIVKFRNETKNTVNVTGQVYTKRGFSNKARWEKLPSIKLAPGQTLTVRGEDNFLVRGSKMRFSAANESDTVRWTQHREKSLELVEERGYRGEEIGSYIYAFRPLTKTATNSPNNSR